MYPLDVSTLSSGKVFHHAVLMFVRYIEANSVFLLLVCLAVCLMHLFLLTCAPNESFQKTLFDFVSALKTLKIFWRICKWQSLQQEPCLYRMARKTKCRYLAFTTYTKPTPVILYANQQQSKIVPHIQYFSSLFLTTKSKTTCIAHSTPNLIHRWIRKFFLCILRRCSFIFF